MKNRSIVMMVVLYIVTLGIYGLYWTCSFQNQLKEKTDEGFTWLGHLVLIFVTFGIYFIYWQYAAGKRLAKLGSTDNSVLYLVFCFVFLSWLNPFLMQNQANKLA
ncbi:MAG: DUF4234 domain-containing protein [Chitinispirillales bacterium]|nr:DUF4234 domain-containing protein [Chitinispirillales bacterium]